MKAIVRLLFTTALLCGWVGTAHGNPPPPAGAATDQPAPPPKPASFTAYLGVVSSPLSAIMRDQLNLQPNQGIVVLAIAPDGPAAKAGITTNDILTRIHDVAIHTPQDLTKTLATRKPGDQVQVQLIRKGKPTACTVTLGGRLTQLSSPQPLDPEVRKILDSATNDHGTRTFRIEIAKADDSHEIEVRNSSSIHMLDDKGSIEMKSINDHREITLRDKENKVIWSGPWTTDNEKNAAPANVRERMKQLDIEAIFESGNMRLKIPSNP